MQQEDGNRAGNDPERKESGDLPGSEPRIHGFLQAWLLLLLAEQENHGYELVRHLSEELPEEMVPDPGVIYRILRRLEQEGAVASTLRSGGGGPARKVYTLTEVGESRLKGWSSTAQERIGLLARFLKRLSRVTGETES
ncbi:MAG: PadR family transcriptional regulator [Spirochaetes bacterium]|jgi:DNA-binding PadR family transcriptional regulator|nr:PadR family transcriptional regulator [Spirochaetota bacterium]